MEEGSGAPAGPDWLAEWPAGPRPSEGEGAFNFFCFFFICSFPFIYSFLFSFNL